MLWQAGCRKRTAYGLVPTAQGTWRRVSGIVLGDAVLPYQKGWPVDKPGRDPQVFRLVYYRGKEWGIHNALDLTGPYQFQFFF